MQQLIKALLVDDEVAALQTLEGMLAEYCPQIKIIGAATNTSEAIKFCNQHQPHVVFLDIEMPPGSDGFEFIRLSSPHKFGVIITTAHPDYAIRAIQHFQPWGYLVKPFEPTELIASVQIAQQKLPTPPPATNTRRQGLIIPDQRKGNIVIHFDDVLFLASEQATVDIVVRKKDKDVRYTVYRPLKEFEQELPASEFCRTHRSYLVNLAWVDRFERTGRNGMLHLANDTHRVEVSSQKMEEFVERFEAYLKGG